jgi:predicted kinase
VGSDQPKVPGTTASLDVPDSGPESRRAGSGKPGPAPEQPKSGPEHHRSSPENLRRGPDNPTPGSIADLRGRSYRLSPGHPSSPVDTDGRPKPPAPRLKDIALPEPLTDDEHAEHVKDIRDRLGNAREHGLRTDQQHTIDPDNKTWSRDRRALHREITDSIYAQSNHVPTDRRAVIAGGLGGAGKTTVLEQYAGIDRSQYLTINPDNIKEEMAKRGLIPHVEGLSPMEASDLAHEESSYIAKRLARRALADGKNVIWDITMSSHKKTEERIGQLRSAGYSRIEGIFVDVQVETAVTRVAARHREGHDDYCAGKGLGGRFVPAEVIERQADPDWGSLNRKNFEAVKHGFDTWTRYENSGPAPVLAEASNTAEEPL